MIAFFDHGDKMCKTAMYRFSEVLLSKDLYFFLRFLKKI